MHPAIRLLCLACVVVVLGQGCATSGGPVLDKPLEGPQPTACCSASGHNPENVPYALGGNCYCAPSQTLVEAMHANGIGVDVDFAALRQKYRDAGIVTDLEHRGCNNLCDHGPHVAFGGKCMATPTPGTKNYERVMLSPRPAR